MVSGRGWIALAAEAMGQRGAVGTAATSLLFGVADALSNAVATLGWPSDLVKTIPYCATLNWSGCLLYQSLQKNETSISAQTVKKED